MWNLKQKTNRKIKLVDTENRFVIARCGDWGMDRMGEAGQKAQTSSYKVSRSRV